MNDVFGCLVMTTKGRILVNCLVEPSNWYISKLALLIACFYQFSEGQNMTLLELYGHQLALTSKKGIVSVILTKSKSAIQLAKVLSCLVWSLFLTEYSSMIDKITQQGIQETETMLTNYTSTSALSDVTPDVKTWPEFQSFERSTLRGLLLTSKDIMKWILPDIQNNNDIEICKTCILAAESHQIMYNQDASSTQIQNTYPLLESECLWQIVYKLARFLILENDRPHSLILENPRPHSLILELDHQQGRTKNKMYINIKQMDQLPGLCIVIFFSILNCNENVFNKFISYTNKKERALDQLEIFNSSHVIDPSQIFFHSTEFKYMVYSGEYRFPNWPHTNLEYVQKQIAQCLSTTTIATTSTNTPTTTATTSTNPPTTTPITTPTTTSITTPTITPITTPNSPITTLTITPITTPNSPISTSNGCRNCNNELTTNQFIPICLESFSSNTPIATKTNLPLLETTFPVNGCYYSKHPMESTIGASTVATPAEPIPQNITLPRITTATTTATVVPTTTLTASSIDVVPTSSLVEFIENDIFVEQNKSSSSTKNPTVSKNVTSSENNCGVIYHIPKPPMESFPINSVYVRKGFRRQKAEEI